MYLISGPEIRPQIQPLISNGARKTCLIVCISAAWNWAVVRGNLSALR